MATSDEKVLGEFKTWLPKPKVKQETYSETLQLLVERMQDLEQRLFNAEQLVKKYEHEKNA